MLGVTNADAVVNFDETNVFFSPLLQHIIETRGARLVSIIEPNLPGRCTAMLDVAMSGRKIDPCTAFASKPTAGRRVTRECMNPGQHGHSMNQCCMVQNNACMDEACALDWIAHVWTPHASSIEGPKLMLLDGCTGHITSSVPRAINATNAKLEFILPGHTSKPQTMDTELNKSFKD